MGMRLRRIEIRNLGPYYGEHSLDFNTDRPLLLIHGANERGKTSFLNAIRWVLYGRVFDRTKKLIPLVDLINSDASAEGDWTMQVKLDLEVDGTPHKLTRHVQQVSSSVTPQKDKDFTEKLFVDRNGQLTEDDEAQTAINRILPEQISRFFLFDGEFLNDYELLLSEYGSNKHAQLIKESIEDILGVPALVNAVSDINVHLKEAGTRQRKVAEQHNRVDIYAREGASIEADVEECSDDLEKLQQEHATLTQRKHALNEALQATAGDEANVKRLKDLERDIDRSEVLQKELLEAKREKLANVWTDVLQPSLRTRRDELEAQLSDLVGNVRETGALQLKLAQLEELDDASQCPLCYQPIVDGISEHLQQDREKVQDLLNQHKVNESQLADVSESLRRLRKVSGAGVVDTVRVIERQLIAIRVDLSDKELEKEGIEELLRNHDANSIARNRREYDEVTKDMGDIEGKIQDKQEQIAELEVKLSENRTRIRDLSPPGLERLSDEVQMYEDLRNIFRRAVGVLRDDLRKSVEQDATDIFLQITRDDTYAGLRINDNYGLTLLDKHGEKSRRSAGAEQVVALSLIGALNRNAVRQGPIVMDTPFGRLDPVHREKILMFLPTMAEQVILLVHGGEIDRDRDLNIISSQVEKEYEIKYVTSRRSELVPIGA